jgi:hypothetical protein
MTASRFADLSEDAGQALQYTTESSDETGDDPEEKRTEKVSKYHRPLDGRYGAGSSEHPHENRSREA